MKTNTLTAEKLKEVLLYSKHYDAWFWLKPSAQNVSGDIAGSVDKKTGYCRITIDGRAYFAHRLVWLWTYGGWPSGLIDHIDGNKLNNRPDNLRDTNETVNSENRRKPSKNSTTGFLGVSAHKNKWQASIRTSGKLVYLGRFDTPEKASAAYIAAKRKAHVGCTI